MRKRLFSALLAATTASALALTGCAVDESKSDSITVACGAMEDLCQKWTQTFTEQTGIQATYVRLSSGETVARLDKYKDADHKWTGVYVGVLGFCSNKTVLKKLGAETPKSWDDLLNPAFKGQVSTAHPSTSGTAFTTLWTQNVRLGGQDQALDYMKKLHSNVLQYTKSGTAPGQIAGRGEVAVGLVFSHDCVKYQEEGMSDLQVSFPKEGTGYEVGGVALVAKSKHSEAAKKYIDWAISADAQNIGQTVGSYQIPPNPDAKISDKMVKLDDVTLVDYNFKAAAEAKPALTKRCDEEIAAQPKE